MPLCRRPGLALRCLLPLAALRLSDALQALDHREEPEDIVNAALQSLRSMWPGGQGERILASATEAMPMRDNGTALQDRLVKKYAKNAPFVFAAFGSSVSAGHDNFPNQSWPFELERLLAPTFKALGFDFQVRQRAMGGYGEMPFAAGCLADRGGSSLDAVSWEHGMFYDAACEGYHFLQEVAGLDGPPVVFAFSQTSIEFGDSIEQSTEARRSTRNRLLTHGDDEDFGDRRVWHENSWYFTDDFVSAAELKKWKESSGFQVHNMRRDINPQHYLQQTGAATIFDQGEFGFYPVVAAAATNFVVYDPWYQAREKAFNINWHPGPMGHTLLASQVAHYILTNLKEVVRVYQRTRSIPTSTKHEGENPLIGKDKMPHLPSGRFCGSMMTKHCSTGVEQPTESLQSLRSPSSSDSWEFGTTVQTVTGWMGQIDQRKVFRGSAGSGELVLNIDVPEKEHYALVCGAPCGWNCRDGFGYVAAKSQRWWPDKSMPPRDNKSDLKYRVDGRMVSASKLVELHDLLFDKETGVYCPGCLNAADVCQPVGKLQPGTHTVGLTVHRQTPERTSSDMSNTYVEVVQVMLVAEP